jgi:hypothetical protein
VAGLLADLTVLAMGYELAAFFLCELPAPREGFVLGPEAVALLAVYFERPVISIRDYVHVRHGLSPLMVTKAGRGLTRCPAQSLRVPAGQPNALVAGNLGPRVSRARGRKLVQHEHWSNRAGRTTVPPGRMTGASRRPRLARLDLVCRERSHADVQRLAGSAGLAAVNERREREVRTGRGGVVGSAAGGALKRRHRDPPVPALGLGGTSADARAESRIRK